ncbi:uncharacterized protein BXIN_1175 [Babesia sp. Xinjiang]|uniref:uncharacterized protein n=1 Tax=Babesia sp. Xinjiang TaxID=462227 RepID=UPI000A2396A8|nr:uncharacterized protein BXIN_1175 [Babesia sp. Xinjiang]ORM40206.1 hypothetical protein BXIN_1175 [Babesia sp. Xinjiang]
MYRHAFYVSGGSATRYWHFQGPVRHLGGVHRPVTSRCVSVLGGYVGVSYRRCIGTTAEGQGTENSNKKLPFIAMSSGSGTTRQADDSAEGTTTRLYRYVLENHHRLGLYTLCGYLERLCQANLADIEVRNLLRLKLLDNLEEVNSPVVMGRVLYLLNKCPSMDDEFFVMITNHIYRNRLYPNGDVPQSWCRYFKFIGDNRLYHRPLLEVMCRNFYAYLIAYMERGRTAFSRRMQESVAIASWALAITAPDLPLQQLFTLMLRFAGIPGVERSVVIRVYWGAAVRNQGLERMELPLIARVLSETLFSSPVGNRHKSHLHQIYTTLRCLNLAGIDDEGLADRCLESLHKLRYGYNDSKISTSHRYVSDVLVRLGVPHKVELLTPDLLSIDIAIEGGGERIALEVDGPVHFTRVCDGSESATPMRTGPTKMKQAFLKWTGWYVLSVPPIKLDYNVDLTTAIASVDLHYKRLLMGSGSAYLSKLLT